MLTFAAAHDTPGPKTAAMSTVTRPVQATDPLDNPETSPAKPMPNWQGAGQRWGGRAGMAAGGIAGALLPPLIGAAMGHAVGTGAEHFLGHNAVTDTLPTAGALTGGIAGLPFAPMGAFGGVLQGGVAGENAGRLVGKGIEHLYSPHRRGVDQARRLSPAEAYALIKARERLGDTSEHFRGLREGYNARREGLRDQLTAGVL